MPSSNLAIPKAFHDFTLFHFSTNDGHVLLLYYVHDMLITGDDQEGIHSLKTLLVKTFLNSQFDIKDLGPLWYFLGIEVAYFLSIFPRFFSGSG